MIKYIKQKIDHTILMTNENKQTSVNLELCNFRKFCELIITIVSSSLLQQEE